MGLQHLLAATAFATVSALAPAQPDQVEKPGGGLPYFNSLRMATGNGPALMFSSREDSVGACLSRAAVMASLFATAASGSPQGRQPVSGVCLDAERFPVVVRQHAPALKAAGLLKPNVSVAQVLHFLGGRKAGPVGVTYVCDPLKSPKDAEGLAHAATELLETPLALRVPVDSVAVSRVCRVTEGSVKGSADPAPSLDGMAPPLMRQPYLYKPEPTPSFRT